MVKGELMQVSESAHLKEDCGNSSRSTLVPLEKGISNDRGNAGRRRKEWTTWTQVMPIRKLSIGNVLTKRETECVWGGEVHGRSERVL